MRDDTDEMLAEMLLMEADLREQAEAGVADPDALRGMLAAVEQVFGAGAEAVLREGAHADAGRRASDLRGIAAFCERHGIADVQLGDALPACQDVGQVGRALEAVTKVGGSPLKTVRQKLLRLAKLHAGKLPPEPAAQPASGRSDYSDLT